MATTSTAERRAKAEAAATRAAALAQQHRAKAMLYAAAGKAEKAAEAEALALRQEAIAAGHRREGERLAERERQDLFKESVAQKTRDALAARSLAVKAMGFTPDPLQVYMQALEEAERVEADAQQLRSKESRLRREGEPHKADLIAGRLAKKLEWAAEWRAQAEKVIASTGGRDLPQERAREIERRAREAGRDAKDAARRADLKLEIDGATAAGQREYVAGGLRKDRIAQLGEYATLIPQAEDRTELRLATMHNLDHLFAGAEQGLFPSPKFGQGTTPGAGAGKLAAFGWADAIERLDSLRRAIGGPNVEMLRARVYERRTLLALARAGYGTDKTAGALVLAALDAAGRWFEEPPRQGERMTPEEATRAARRKAPPPAPAP